MLNQGKNMIFKTVTIYTFLHFLVDFSCAILLYHQVYPIVDNPIEIAYCFLFYNFFAFAVQLPIGIIADHVRKNSLFASLGCLIIALAHVCAPLGLFACIIAGIGNALFHIGAGVDILNLSKGKAALPGIFVSSGALGIFLGTQSFFNHTSVSFITIALMVFGSIASHVIYKKYHSHLNLTIVHKTTYSFLTLFVITCLSLTVLLRSYTGFVFAFEWKQPFAIGLVFTLGIVFGKMFGGIFSDKFGIKKTAILSLLFSMVFFWFSFQNNVIGIISGTLGVLLFNMTMPITLTALTNLMPTQKGMAFGLLTFMLFLGAIPLLSGLKTPFFSPLGLSILILSSAFFLYCGLIKTQEID